MTKQDSTTGVEKELLPCPFCGSKVILNIAYTCKIFCLTCGEIKRFTDEAPAVKWWNTRADDSLRSQNEALREALKLQAMKTAYFNGQPDSRWESYLCLAAREALEGK